MEVYTMDNIECFELGTILSVTTGYNCVDNFDKVWELIWFVCDDDMIGPIGLGTVKDKIKEHLLTLYPELKSVEFQKGKNNLSFILCAFAPYPASYVVYAVGNVDHSVQIPQLTRELCAFQPVVASIPLHMQHVITCFL